ERWTVRETNCETVTLERDGKIRQFKPSAKGKWNVLAPSTMQVSVGDQIRVTAGFREGKKSVQKQRYCRATRDYRHRARPARWTANAQGWCPDRSRRLHHLSRKSMPYSRSGCCVAGRRRRERLVRQPVAGSGCDARLHAQQARVASIRDATRR